MAKTQFQLRDIGKILEKSSDSFQDPPLISAPFTTITDLSGNTRKLADPSKTLRPAMGIERIHTKAKVLVANEKGANGEQVWKIQDGDDRVRFVGEWGGSSNTHGQAITNPASSSGDNYIEITFYGTGLNLLRLSTGNLRDIRISVDGGAEGSNLEFIASTILNGRGYGAHQLLPLVSNLSLGIHTVKVRDASVTFGSFIYGFEVLNEEADIQVPEGEIFANGRKYAQNADTTTSYNSGFDGNPVLNGRGGRVLMYKLPDNETVYKAIQQTNASQLNLASADHTNEEVIRKINFREFGANRADDFSTLTTVSDRTFTLDDGTTTLAGNDVLTTSAESVRTLVVNGFNILTFIGTGLDIVYEAVGALPTSSTFDVSVDGTSVFTGQLTQTSLLTPTILKIVSGLPYGTHTVKIRKTVLNGNWDIGIKDFIIYGPKKLSIPSSAIEIGEYYLMADFVANSTFTLLSGALSTGILRKNSMREMIYSGTWSIANDNSAFLTYLQPESLTNGGFFEYTFYGTGFDYRFNGSTNRSANVTVAIDGVNYTGAGTVYGTGTTWTPGSSTLDTAGSASMNAGFIVTGLTLEKHTVRFTNNTVNILGVESMDIITPIHYPNTKVGSLSMGNSVPVLQQSKESSVDLSKAKAWIAFDYTNSKILNSFNISAVLKTATGRAIFYLEKPLKAAGTIIGSSNHNRLAGVSLTLNTGTDNRISFFEGVVVDASTNSFLDVTQAYFVVFGELADEEGNE